MDSVRQLLTQAERRLFLLLSKIFPEQWGVSYAVSVRTQGCDACGADTSGGADVAGLGGESGGTC